jgi:hypothetical protein
VTSPIIVSNSETNVSPRDSTAFSVSSVFPPILLISSAKAPNASLLPAAILVLFKLLSKF